MLPLEGIRILDLSRILAGPYCTMLLGDLGAEVIKVERPGTGDDTRTWGPPFAGGEAAYYLCCNRNKKSITIDMKSPEGLSVVKDLVRKSDAVVENFSPGVMEKFGLDYGALKELNPKIIFCSITGFGQDGPYREKTGYDMVLSAVGGLMGITGEEDGGPVKVGVAITDVCTGLLAYGAIIAALYRRDKTGQGERIDLSLLDTQVSGLVNIASSFLVTGRLPRRWGTQHESIVPYQAFRTKDDSYVAIAAANDKLWAKLCRVMGREELIDDPRFKTNPLRVENRKECIRIVGEEFLKKTRDEWVALLEAETIPCGPINNMAEVFDDPQIRHRRMLSEVDHPTAGKLRMVGVPIKFTETPLEIRRHPPLLGQHTDDILKEILEYGPDEIERLRKAKAI